MTDTYTDEEPRNPADPPAPLVDFVSQFEDPQAREMFGDAAIRVQNYMMQREIAAQTEAASNRLVSNLGQFKDGLAGMVYQDPAALDLGLDIAPDIIDGIVSANPFIPDDQRESMRSGIVSDVQREIAMSGVRSLAEKDAVSARGMLYNERVSALLDDRQRTALEGHISAMDMARGIDATATAQQRAVDDQRTTDFSATQYLGALVDPNTREVQFPTDWAQRVMLDPTLGPADTASMLGVYQRLQTSGDAAQSDPFLLASIVERVASGEGIGVRDILSEAGRGLRVADAVGLARNTVANMQPSVQKEFRDLAASIDTARSFLASPENGPAGHMAFGRFMNWFMGSYPAGRLDPNSDQPFELGAALTRFLPTSDDMMRTVRPVPENRVPLDQIFGPRKGA